LQGYFVEALVPKGSAFAQKVQNNKSGGNRKKDL
jgi:hypothetical protein